MSTTDHHQEVFQERHSENGGFAAPPAPWRRRRMIVLVLFPLCFLLHIWDSTQHFDDHPYDVILKVNNMSSTTTISNIETTKPVKIPMIPLDSSKEEEQEEQEDNDQLDIPYSGLWIHVETWGEGIAGWQVAFASLMVAAKRLNAVVVEPGIRNARLVPCNEGKLRFSQVFNRTRLMEYHSLIASCTQYEAAQKNQSTELTIVDVCLKTKDQFCITPQGKKVQSDYHGPVSKAIDRALERVRKDPNETVVLRLHNFSKSALDNLEIKNEESPNNDNDQEESQALRVPLVDKKQPEYFEQHHYRFLDTHYTFLQTQLERNGIKDYAVIHWRAELKSIDYEGCAKKIWDARSAMNVTPGTSFILVSSLSANSETETPGWGGAERYANQNQTAKQSAMASLLQSGRRNQFPFLKMDTMLPQLEDSILYVVMDLILAEKALEFATCSDRCTGRRFESCRQCNYMGRFSKLAMASRGKENPTTYPCWPSSTGQSELADINTLWTQS